MKKIKYIFILIFIFFNTIIYAKQDIFIASIIDDAPSSGLGACSFQGSLGGTMLPANGYYCDLLCEGGYHCDFVYNDPPTLKHNSIILGVVFPGYFSSKQTTFCMLKYDAITRKVKWIKNIPFQPPIPGFPMVKCSYKLYGKNLFLIVSGVA